MTRWNNAQIGDLYSAYSAGTLDAGFKLMLEAQAHIRADISERVDFANALSGAFLENETPTELSANARDRAMAQIDSETEFETKPEAAAAMEAGSVLEEMLNLPENLHDAMFDAVEADGWSRLMSGIERLPLKVGSEAEVELYRLTPGAKVPRHKHDGAEMTLVLKGRFSDETGSFSAGDIAIKGPDDIHTPTVHDDDGICYTLAIRDGDLRFTGARGVLQRIMDFG